MNDDEDRHKTYSLYPQKIKIRNWRLQIAKLLQVNQTNNRPKLLRFYLLLCK